MLRIDVGGTAPYVVPADNPFVGVAGARSEIWSYGLRNPWRYSFDRANGDLYVADVGQDNWEEVDYEPVGAGGRNYGWNNTEGTHCYPSGSTCSTAGLTMPVTEYPHSVGCSVTGGYVYRGGVMPELQGTYFYGDYCTGVVRSLKIAGGKATEEFDWTSSLRTQAGGAMTGLSAFGLDGKGELYLVILGGEVYRLAPKP
jgi:glucose/arabinose dehydrogenase